jgi:hypothetical protein
MLWRMRTVARRTLLAIGGWQQGTASADSRAGRRAGVTPVAVRA